MNAKTEVGCGILWIGLLAAIYSYMGERVFTLATCFSLLWFTIAMVLLYRPPAVPEFVSEQGDPDEQFVIRRDVLPRLPWLERLRWSMCVASGSCLLIWLSLVLLAT
ncbi:hypothetical protein [Aureliella helgolandensis]|uniref:Uncharacterized protein n=1 Tax=Aureliella helgolandensis TaxID=2527968 RepID=A0A518GFC2_9BACT|nr:hypothetical protein [Aureliella helgolandensis]QDV27258.1 hypothetical protein Q31a_56460 [Aureliella helgolandensis]